jgi:creatinine amidohydrolase
MRQSVIGLGVAVVVASGLAAAQAPRVPGVALADLSWQEAEQALTPSSIVVLPLGVATVQHGPHLKLNNNERLARYLAGRVQAAAAAVVIAPPLTYHFYPTFLEYPGSTSLSLNTSRDMTAEIVRTLAKYGPRRFYVLNTGVTTMFPLKDAAEALAAEGILLGYTDMRYHLAGAPVAARQTPTRGAVHADEIETSMMLFVDPSAVDMRKAVREYGPGSGPMTRQKDAPGTFSASGVVGDPTLATSEKGRVYVDAVLAGVLDDIEKMRVAPLPVARAPRTVTPPPPAPRPAAARTSEEKLPNGCVAGDERAIRAVGERFSYLWRQMDADKLAELFTADGDMRHPDGTIERGQIVLRDNRRELFNKREYRGSVHSVQLNDIRCLSGGTAIADGKWELRLEDDAQNPPAPRRGGLGPGRRHAGWCTLVLVSRDSGWSIQAWRYTINPPDGTPAPTTLKQPGFLGRGGGH